MKVRVDSELCQLHGQCTYAAPGVFAIDGDDLRVVESPGESQWDLVREAAEACPEQAIFLDDV